MTETHLDFRVAWSPEDDEYVATVDRFPSVSWLAPGPLEALAGLLEALREDDLVPALLRGIQEAREGRTVDLGDFSRYLED